MDSLAESFRHKFNLSNAIFTLIDHEDAIEAAVYKVLQAGSPDFVLKICSSKGSFLRESYF